MKNSFSNCLSLEERRALLGGYDRDFLANHYNEQMELELDYTVCSKTRDDLDFALLLAKNLRKA